MLRKYHRPADVISVAFEICYCHRWSQKLSDVFPFSFSEYGRDSIWRCQLSLKQSHINQLVVNISRSHPTIPFIFCIRAVGNLGMMINPRFTVMSVLCSNLTPSIKVYTPYYLLEVGWIHAQIGPPNLRGGGDLHISRFPHGLLVSFPSLNFRVHIKIWNREIMIFSSLPLLHKTTNRRAFKMTGKFWFVMSWIKKELV